MTQKLPVLQYLIIHIRHLERKRIPQIILVHFPRRFRALLRQVVLEHDVTVQGQAAGVLEELPGIQDDLDALRAGANALRPANGEAG